MIGYNGKIWVARMNMSTDESFLKLRNYCYNGEKCMWLRAANEKHDSNKYSGHIRSNRPTRSLQHDFESCCNFIIDWLCQLATPK